MAHLKDTHLDPFTLKNTPGTAGGPGGRHRTLAVKSRKTSEKSPFFLKKIKFTPKKYFLLHISFSYAKILGEKLFRTMVITMAKLRMAHASTHGARKPPGPKKMHYMGEGFPLLTRCLVFVNFLFISATRIFI